MPIEIEDADLKVLLGIFWVVFEIGEIVFVVGGSKMIEKIFEGFVGVEDRVGVVGGLGVEWLGLLFGGVLVVGGVGIVEDNGGGASPFAVEPELAEIVFIVGKGLSRVVVLVVIEVEPFGVRK